MRFQGFDHKINELFCPSSHYIRMDFIFPCLGPAELQGVLPEAVDLLNPFFRRSRWSSKL